MIAWCIRKTFENLVLLTDWAKTLVEHIQGLGRQIFGWVGPVHIQGSLFISVPLFTYFLAFFKEEEAKTIMDARVLFYCRLITGASSVIAGALTAFRSRAYSDHVAEKKSNGTGNTTFIPKP